MTVEAGAAAPGLFDGLVDDAGLFPPEQLPMREALARHDADAAAGHPVLTHRFLCPATRLDELIGGVGAGQDGALALGVIVPLAGAGVGDTVARAGDDRRLRLAVVEGPLPAGGGTLAEAAREAVRVRALIGDGTACHAEVPLVGDWRDALRVLADAGVAAKVRCGGVRAELFPDVEQLAAFVFTCVRLSLPFKATAGLHHAVRHRDERTGFTHHGFLNLLMATSRAVEGGGEAEVAEVLRTTDAADLAARARAVDPGIAARTRGLFTAYGSCSTSEPIDDLRALDLIPAAAASSRSGVPLERHSSDA